MKKRPAVESIDEYILGYPPAVQALLRKMRAAIKNAAPEAEEAISFRLPAFLFDGKVIVWFSALTSHIGFYPGPESITEFSEDFSKYKHGKGCVQFPFTQPLPLDLVDRIVKHRVKAMKNTQAAKPKW